MTPEQHAKAIEDAARKVTQASIDYMVDSGLAYMLGRAESALKAAIRSAVGAAPPKDSAEFALAALVAAGYVSQSKVNYARALMPEGGYVAKAAPEGWQDISTAPKDESPILLGYLPHPKLDRRVFEGRWCETQQTWTSVNGFLMHNDATHWAPLPPAPKP